jgi:hypothetical protein
MTTKHFNLRNPQQGEPANYHAVPTLLIQAIASYLRKQSYEDVVGFLDSIDAQSIPLFAEELDSEGGQPIVSGPPTNGAIEAVD